MRLTINLERDLSKKRRMKRVTAVACFSEDYDAKTGRTDIEMSRQQADELLRRLLRLLHGVQIQFDVD